MSEHQYKFNVVMTCGGCSGAVTRVLEKAKNNGEGISSYEVKQEAHEVLVTGTIPYDDLLAKIKKTGKEASFLHWRPIHTYLLYRTGQIWRNTRLSFPCVTRYLMLSLDIFASLESTRLK